MASTASNTAHSPLDSPASRAIIVCLGQPLLWNTVNLSRNDQGIGATVYARFGLKLNLESSTAVRVDPTDGARMFRPKRQWLHTPEDVKRCLDARKVKVHPAVLNWLHKLANCPSYGGFHELEDIVSVFERYCAETPVMSLEVLAQVDSVIRPPDEQRRMREAVDSLRPAAAG